MRATAKQEAEDMDREPFDAKSAAAQAEVEQQIADMAANLDVRRYVARVVTPRTRTSA